jgi:hypothetical protein
MSGKIVGEWNLLINDGTLGQSLLPRKFLESISIQLQVESFTLTKLLLQVHWERMEALVRIGPHSGE